MPAALIMVVPTWDVILVVSSTAQAHSSLAWLTEQMKAQSSTLTTKVVEFLTTPTHVALDVGVEVLRTPVEELWDAVSLVFLEDDVMMFDLHHFAKL